VIYAPEDSGKRHASQASAHGQCHDRNEPETLADDSEACEAGGESGHEEVKVGRKRQVVGIVVSLLIAALSVRLSLKPL
jgi:hypothetical protein